jgi:hypothetical protein
LSPSSKKKKKKKRSTVTKLPHPPVIEKWREWKEWTPGGIEGEGRGRNFSLPGQR